MKYDYDLFVMGAGSGGVRASRIAAGHGAKVAICEESRVGGTCVIRGCVPKKLMVYASHMSQEIELAKSFGWDIAESTFSWSHFIQAKDKEINRLNGIYLSLLKNAGVILYNGKGSVVDAHHVKVGTQIISAEKILIAVGSWPYLPEIQGIEHVVSSNEMFQLADLPDHICVVGGGYIAVEFSCILNAFGKKVTQIVRSDKILRHFDQEAVYFLQKQMEESGIQFCFNTVIEKISKMKSKKIIHTSDEDIETDLILYATGRVPKSSNIGLEALTVQCKKNGAIIVNSDFQTSVPSIYAIGDVTDRHNLTPIATAEGHAFADNNFSDLRHRDIFYNDIPTAIFSQPPFSTVGLSEEEAREKYEIDVYASIFRPMKYTLSSLQEKSFFKLIVDKKTDKVLGCHIVGLDSAEILQMVAVAIKAGATKADFDQTIGIHPTSAEELVTMRNKRI